MQDNEYAVAIFAVGCAVIGILAVLVDLVFYVLRGVSPLGLKHSITNTPVAGLCWALGALIIGYIGQMTNVFQVSLLSCVTVGSAWPVVFTQVIEKARKKEDVQQTTEENEK
jgi:hypothetical protein